MLFSHIILVILSFSYLYSGQFIFEDINEYKINNEKVDFIIEAKIKKIDLQRIKKFKLYNKESLISTSSYYEDGMILKKDLRLNFKKAYFLEGNFIMNDISGEIKDITLNGKKAVLKKEEIVFDNVLIKQHEIKRKKLKATFKLQ